MAALASPLRTPARQARSQVTSDAIVEAGLALLRERDFATLSVAEVAERAGVSIGGFYARFRGKEALLHALADEVIGDCATGLEEALRPDRMARASLPRVIRAYVGAVVAKFREHRVAIVQILRHVRQGDRHLGGVVADFNQRVHGRLRALLADRRDQIGHPDPTLAVNFGLFLVSAGAREAILSDSLRVYPIEVADAKLVDELTRAYLAYLAPKGKAARAVA
ncbi:MAG: TetR/AcrR family transcriptional regulator [Gemmatimonadales bacterium]